MSSYEAITTVGGLLPSGLLERVRAGDKDLEGTSPESYGLVPGERINDHITRSWNRLRGVWESYAKQLDALPEFDRGTTLARQRWCRPLLDELGFAGLPAAIGLEVDGKQYPISHDWADHVPIHIMGARIEIDRRAAGVAGAAAMSPHGLVQEFLNRSTEHLWGIVTNGSVLRVLRDNASLTKQAYVEFDLQAMFDGELFSDFAVFWLSCHRTRFEGDPPEKCLLERWALEAAQSGTRALDKLRDGVERAITALGAGFIAHPANTELRDAIRSGQVTTTELQRQVLRIVYRLLFLLVAESRDLLHTTDVDPTARERYRRFYSIERLRTLAARRRGGLHDDLWDSTLLVMHGFWHDGVPALGLSPLGSALWSPESILSLDGARIDNAHLLDAIRALCFVRDDEARSDRGVDYRNLGAEELGSIYESLLELHAEVDVDARTFALATAAGSERKTTGSYYTPTSLITELLDSALDPVLDEAATQPDPEAALLELKVIDPAAGSGHFLIAAAHRIAGRLASIRAGGGEPAPHELRSALRDVVSNCIYAIDVNPMAVELCKVSMWLEGMEPGRPLSFLDHRIVCGNALLGASRDVLESGVPDDAFEALVGDEQAHVSSLRRRNRTASSGQQSLLSSVGTRLVEIAADAEELADLREDTVDAVELKARRWQELASSVTYRRELFAADLWCSAFVAPKRLDAPSPSHEDYALSLDGPDSVRREIREVVSEMAKSYSFLHWHLAFPDVFGAGERSGFDVVLGNPPWDQVETDPREFFAATRPDIAGAPSQAARSRLIERLADSDPVLYNSFRAAERRGQASRHLITHGGRFPLSSYGRINTAPCFVETCANALSSHGMLGLVVPTGVATDRFNSDLISSYFRSDRVKSIYDFRNRGFFPGAAAAQGNRFCLLTLSGSPAVAEGHVTRFIFGAESTSELSLVGRTFELTRDDIARLNPETGTAPVFASRREAVTVSSIYRRFDVLGEHGSNSWEGLPARILFQMSESESPVYLRDELRHALAISKVPYALRMESNSEAVDLLGVTEGKMFHSFDHRFGTYSPVILGEKGVRALPHPTAEERESPHYCSEFRKWLPAQFVQERLAEQGWRHAWLLAFRDVTSRTDYRTVVATILPTKATDRSAPAILFGSDVARKSAYFVVLTNSFAFDYIARQKIGGTHLTFNVFRQIAAPSVDQMEEFSDVISGSDGRNWLLSRVAELLITTWEMGGVASSLGIDAYPFGWDADRRAAIRSELDAFAFHLIGMDRHQVAHVMDTFNIVRDRNERLVGEYKTKRLVLERYDAMARAAAGGREYQSILDPPPADPSLAHDPSTRPEWADWYLEGSR